MNRSKQLSALTNTSQWDIVIIGGGATGAGAALDAASRGYKTLLIEQYDFAKGTSSKSTKLVHGGVRYLQQGNIKLVLEALRERGRLLKNAPHLTSNQAFIVPVFSTWEKIFYAIGLKMYGLLAGKLSLGKTSILNKQQVVELLPSIKQDKLVGGIQYYDGQFDDSNLCIEILGTAVKHGATVINYCKAIGFEKEAKKINGVKIADTITNQEYNIKAKAVINATGAFTNQVMEMDDKAHHDFVTASQGIHFIINKEFFKGTTAMMIPKTDDGRVLFAVPWQDKVIVGTTDTPINEAKIEPLPLAEEIEFILNHINRYGTETITRANINSVYVGLRPLIKVKSKAKTSALSRDHAIHISDARLITITGGKWTTYRKMASDAVNNATFIGKLKQQKCITENLQINLTDQKQEVINNLIKQDATLSEKIHPNYTYTKAEIIYAVNNQMAFNVEDVLARRIRLLFLDARVAMQVAPLVASVMASTLNKNQDWAEQQISSFNALASNYILS